MSTGEWASGQQVNPEGTVPLSELLACEDILLGPWHPSLLGSAWRHGRADLLTMNAGTVKVGHLFPTFVTRRDKERSR